MGKPNKTDKAAKAERAERGGLNGAEAKGAEVKGRSVRTVMSRVVDRETEFPCRTCRKRDSCLQIPRDGKCVSLEVGEPFAWRDTYDMRLQVGLEEG
jgi:hypothetical protein